MDLDSNIINTMKIRRENGCERVPEAMITTVMMVLATANDPG
jgi:hypothetical protein